DRSATCADPGRCSRCASSARRSRPSSPGWRPSSASAPSRRVSPPTRERRGPPTHAPPARRGMPPEARDMRASDLARSFSGPAGLDTQGEGSERERNEWPCPACGRLTVADEGLLDPLDPDLGRLAVADGLGLTAFGLIAVLWLLIVHQPQVHTLAEHPGRT